jgi:single-stranded-DNA-specific exonuclease
MYNIFSYSVEVKMGTSFLGKSWRFPDYDMSKLELIKRETGVNDIVARIFINRGLEKPEEVVAFLKAKLKNTIPEPSLLLDMDKGVDRLVRAILLNEKVMIFGDYDIDGVTSTYLIVEYLRLIEREPVYKVPDRFVDGYGLSEKIVEEAAEREVKLLIIVDAGIGSINEVMFAKNLGIDVIIIDHHTQTKPCIPEAVAVVNPNRADQKEIKYSYIKYLCAVGVVFVFMIALQRRLKSIAFFNERVKAVDLHKFIDVVALGTLCDSVRLIGMNRAIVKYCIKIGVCSRGILSLMEAFEIPKIDSPDGFSFYIGPAMNAAGRVGNPMMALELLLENDLTESRKISEKLLEFNNMRKEIEKQALSDALSIIHSMNLNTNNGICVFGDGWHEGVIGIISGRIKDKFNKPSFVISFNQEGIGRGSSRSVSGCHIGHFFEKARGEGIILDGGGHALAGGFSIHKSKIKEFLGFIDKNITNCNLTNTLNIDYSISAKSSLQRVREEISLLEPFGMGIEKPIFAIKRVRMRCIRETKSGAHKMLTFVGESGNCFVQSIVFGAAVKDQFMKLLEENRDNLMDIAGRINTNKYGDSFVIEDARLSI